MRSQWLYDVLAGVAFRSDGDPDARNLDATRLTIVQYQQHPGGHVIAGCIRHPGYLFGLEDPVLVRTRSVARCPEKIAEQCDRAWSPIAVADGNPARFNGSGAA